MKKFFYIAVILILSNAPALFAEPVVIVNNDVSVSEVDADTVKKIYLGKKSKWNDGKKIAFVALKDGSVHSAFLDAYIKKSPSQFSTYWKQMIFSGKGLPPNAFGSEAEIVQYVSATSGAIGYVDSATPCDGVQAIK